MSITITQEIGKQVDMILELCMKYWYILFPILIILGLWFLFYTYRMWGGDPDL